MDRCYISEQIADYCNQPEPLECPVCGEGMTQDEYGCDYFCDDEECSGVIYAPDEDCF